MTTKLPRQTRGNFNTDAVMTMLRDGREPEQGWPSLVEEACQQIYAMRSKDLRKMSDQIKTPAQPSATIHLWRWFRCRVTGYHHWIGDRCSVCKIHVYG